MRCQQCHATLKRGYRIDDSDVGHGQEYRCDGCGAVGCVLDSGRRIGEAVNADATSQPSPERHQTTASAVRSEVQP